MNAIAKMGPPVKNDNTIQETTLTVANVSNDALTKKLTIQLTNKESRKIPNDSARMNIDTINTFFFIFL